MNFDSISHHRRSIRLKGYDYTQPNCYFITICCQNRANLFGWIQDGEMQKNDSGQMIEHEWLGLTARFNNISLKSYIVMPNHFHGIIKIKRNSSEGMQISKTIGDVIDAFKSITTVKYIDGVNAKNWQTFDKKIWQRNYYEHIVRNNSELMAIEEYILNNPKNWHNDELNSNK